jgi:hypothetical protein
LLFECVISGNGRIFTFRDPFAEPSECARFRRCILRRRGFSDSFAVVFEVAVVVVVGGMEVDIREEIG